ncbi:MAG: MCE family protein, partial [Candidatus Dormibacteraeota bacterium]|nr:MCE family protein [Candidatus Dormibacteraeota bacterium]
MKRQVNPVLSGSIAAAVLIVVMLAVVISGIPGGPQIPLPWSQRMTLGVQLSDADALAPHASVEIAGVKVGEVESVSSQGNLALATLQIDPQDFDIHSDATVYLRPHGLFGPKYIDIVPGTSSAPALANGATIKVNQTVQPVDLDSILQDLQAPEHQNLRTTIVELGQAAAGQGDDVNHLITAADSLTQVLDSPIKNLDTVAPNLSDMLVKDDAFNQAFAQTPLDSLVANNETTFQAFANNASHLDSLLVHANKTLSALQTALNDNGANLGNALVTLGKPVQVPSSFAPQGQPNPATTLTVVQQLQDFTYLIGLFGDNLIGLDPAYHSANVLNGINGAITNVQSALSGFDNTCATNTQNH